MKNLIKTFTAVTIMAFAGAALSQDGGHLNVRTVVQKEEITLGDDGSRQTRLVDAGKVVPGDEVIYTVSFANVSDEAAENIVITNPLPAELTYVDGSAFGPGAEVQFSVDGGRSFGGADELLVSDGGSVRPAGAEDFTHIRWVISNRIAPGAEGIAQFRARLN